jgi:hypothetical protein
VTRDMSRSAEAKKWFTGIVLAALLGVQGCRGSGKISSKGQALESIQKYAKAHDYDQAIKTGTDWLTLEPHDAFMSALIGQLYVEKAAANTTDQARLLGESSQYIDRAISVAPQDVAVLDVAARAREAAGDLSANERCDRYKNAFQLIEKKDTALKKEFDSADPVWAKVKSLDELFLARLARKIQSSGCQ